MMKNRPFYDRPPFSHLKVQGNEKGFTLLEVIIGISVLTFGLLAVASMQVSSIQGNAAAIEVTEAATWAEDQIEKLMALPYDDPDLDPGGHAPVVRGSYTISWVVADNDPLEDTKTVNVTVSWSDHGASKDVSIQHVIPRMI
jgi:type IV pilus assembly protein PilV